MREGNAMRTIEVDGLFNVRGLFSVRADSVSVPWLVRSGTTVALTATGAAQLRRLGVRTALDLREPDEAERPGHGLPVVSVPLYGRTAPCTGRLEDIYDALLRERGAAFATAIGILAEADGAVLVHCTAGKDRTGLLTALTLAAVGTDAEAIAADYVRSGPLLRPAREALAARLAEDALPDERADILRLHLDSPREAIDHALSTLVDLGGVVSYLHDHGLTAAQLARLRMKAGPQVTPRAGHWSRGGDDHLGEARREETGTRA